MFALRRAGERGHSQLDWLDSWHTFSFGDYDDPAHRSFETLRVLNDDVIAAGAGFATHPHQNMEIVSYVLDGTLAHKDSMGNGSLIHAGDVQRMSAGTGVTHSEYNASSDSAVHLLQIWFYPLEREHRVMNRKRLLIPKNVAGSDWLSLPQDAMDRCESVKMFISPRLFYTVLRRQSMFWIRGARRGYTSLVVIFVFMIPNLPKATLWLSQKFRFCVLIQGSILRC